MEAAELIQYSTKMKQANQSEPENRVHNTYIVKTKEVH